MRSFPTEKHGKESTPDVLKYGKVWVKLLFTKDLQEESYRIYKPKVKQIRTYSKKIKTYFKSFTGDSKLKKLEALYYGHYEPVSSFSAEVSLITGDRRRETTRDETKGFASTCLRE